MLSSFLEKVKVVTSILGPVPPEYIDDKKPSRSSMDKSSKKAKASEKKASFSSSHGSYIH
jgi:hypothetical protein